MRNVDTLEPTNRAAPAYFATPPLKFAAMSICTFSLYEIYWSYKNWRIIKERDRPDIMPFWRALFHPLWHYSLLTELDKTLESPALSKAINRGSLAAIVVLLDLAVRLPDPYWLVSLLGFVAFLPALVAMQKRQSSGAIQEQSSSFHPANLIAYLLGGPLVVLVTLSAIGVAPAAVVVPGDAMRERDLEYLRESEILAPDENIVYFYSEGLLSIAEGGQFFSDEYVTSCYRDPDTKETYVDFAAFSDIRDIDVVWAEGFLDLTVVTITVTDGYQFELWLSPEAKGDRKFVDAMTERWNESRPVD